MINRPWGPIWMRLYFINRMLNGIDLENARKHWLFHLFCNWSSLKIKKNTEIFQIIEHNTMVANGFDAICIAILSGNKRMREELICCVRETSRRSVSIV